MRVVVQRVREARVEVADECVGRIGSGLLLLVAFEHGDGLPELSFMAEKIVHLRIFPDEEGRMNRSVREIGGAILSVSQFTLASRIRKGRRPDFTQAAEPAVAEGWYQRFNEMLAQHVPVATGRFGAMMDIHLVNNGPVTFIIERRPALVSSEE